VDSKTFLALRLRGTLGEIDEALEQWPREHLFGEACSTHSLSLRSKFRLLKRRMTAWFPESQDQRPRRAAPIKAAHTNTNPHLPLAFFSSSYYRGLAQEALKVRHSISV
jgi:hypothetical protein